MKKPEEQISATELKIYNAIVKEMIASKIFEVNLKDEELRQNAYLQFLLMRKLKVIEIYSQGAINLKQYIVRICENEYNKQFTKKATRVKEMASLDCMRDSQLPQTIETELKIIENSELTQFRNVLNKLHWYDRQIYELYLSGESYRKLAKRIGVKYGSIFVTVKKVKAILSEELNDK
jgi:DNA-directed RNA polymerase specialized sigma24 family protein